MGMTDESTSAGLVAAKLETAARVPDAGRVPSPFYVWHQKYAGRSPSQLLASDASLIRILGQSDIRFIDRDSSIRVVRNSQRQLQPPI